MSMAFRYAYGELCDRNINHIYTYGKEKPPAKRKRTMKYEPQFLETMESKRHQRWLNRHFMEYYPKWEIDLPRAPAFRTFDSSYMDNVVTRLTHPTRYDHTRWCDAKVMSQKTIDWYKVEEERKEKLKTLLKQFGKPQFMKEAPVTDENRALVKLPPVVKDL